MVKTMNIVICTAFIGVFHTIVVVSKVLAMTFHKHSPQKSKLALLNVLNTLKTPHYCNRIYFFKLRIIIPDRSFGISVMFIIIIYCYYR